MSVCDLLGEYSVGHEGAEFEQTEHDPRERDSESDNHGATEGWLPPKERDTGKARNPDDRVDLCYE